MQKLWEKMAVRQFGLGLEIASGGTTSQRGIDMRALLNKFMKDESGQGLVEYALIIALVAIGLIAILVLFRNSIGNVFNESKNRLNNAPSGSY